MILRPITKKDYNKIIELDKKIYPSSSALSEETLDRWYLGENSKFGMIYEKDSEVVGMCIAIALNKEAWEKLVNGQIQESDLNKKDIFDNNRDKELGIHIFHIEKFDNNLKDFQKIKEFQEIKKSKGIKKFHKIVLEDMSKIIDDMKTTNPELKVVGLSGLCVTDDGDKLFSDVLGCSESQYKSKEYIFEKDGKRVIFEFDNETASDNIKAKENEGYKFLQRCKMFVSNSSSIIFDFFN